MLLRLTGCQHCSQPRYDARGSRCLPPPSPRAGDGRELGPGAPGPRLSWGAVAWTRQGQPCPGQRHSSPWNTWLCEAFSSVQTSVLLAKIQLEFRRRVRPEPRHGCPGYRRAQQRGSASRLSGAAPRGKGTDWRVRIVSPPCS